MPDNRKNSITTPGSWQATPLLPLSEPGGDYPLSFQQKRLWFLHQLNADDCSYNESAVYLMRGRLDRARLQCAFDLLLERWHILRTIYRSPKGAPVQHVLARARVTVNFTQPVGLTESDRMSAAMAMIRQQIAKPFDLASELPLRVQVYSLADNSHLMLILTHHIATDGWSWPILIRDLFGSYSNGLPQDVENQLSPPALQYADYAIWQQTNQTDDALQPALSFWKRRLEGQATLSLFPDRLRPPVRSYRGAGLTLSLPSDVSDRCKHFAREQRVTLFVLLLSVFKVLLARRSGQSDIVVGVPVANRTTRDLEPMIGFFANTIAARTELSNDSSLAELLKKVQTDWLESLEYQDTPFEKLVATLQLERDLSRNPVFQVMFALHNIPPFCTSLDELELERVPIEPAAAKFDMEFSLWETSHGIEGLLTYDTDLFEASTIEQMAAQYTMLLKAAISDPDASIYELPMLSPPERLRVIEEWNATQFDYPKCTLNELFELQARQTPHRIAVQHGDVSLTFAELNSRANRLAAHLRRLGVRQETIVAVQLDRTPELIIAIMAVLKAGGAYMPLDTSLPAERRQFMLSDSRAGVVITSGGIRDIILSATVQIVDLGECAELAAHGSAEDVPPETTAENTAYINYTSGSTGRPNGVVGLHRGMVNRLFWMWSRYPFDGEDVCCMKTRIGFVDSIAEIFGPLLKGVCLVVIDDADVLDPHRFTEILNRNRVTRLILVPSLLRVLLESLPDIGERLPHLNSCVVSGEALAADLAHLFGGLLPGRKLLNFYGSTEVSADVAFAEIAAPSGEKLITIGRPIANSRIYILDPRLEPVPIGVPGELFVAGHGLAREYLHRPDLTRRRFVADPFSRVPDTYMFRTGDRGRFRADGQIEFLGRNDDQVKLRGVRVALGEVEQAMRSINEVADAVVVALPEPAAAAFLVGFFRALKPGHDPRLQQRVRAALHSRLPATNIPARLIQVDAFPQTASGKIDRLALARSAETTDKPLAPGVSQDDVDELLRRLLEIWREILSIETVDPDTNFFEIGGHSLSAVSLMMRIEHTFGIRLPLTTLFEAPTVRLLGARMRGTAGPTTAFLLGPAQTEWATEPLFCLHGLFLFRSLAGELGANVPTYGIYVDEEIYGLNESGHASGLLKYLVTHYISKIKSVRPNGPYHLAGLSRGGLIAIETARQLVLAGDAIGLVALFDTNAPGAVRQPRLARLRAYWQSCADHLNFRRSGLPDNRELRAAAAIDETMIRELYDDSFHLHQTEQYDGDVVVFRADTSNWGERPDDLGWRRYVRGNVTVQVVPGDHTGILKPPHVAHLSAMLKPYLSPC